ncbi:histone-lysine N-methyltransferase 2D-like isoform X2 [Megalobrama amblycephala]|uniref:histone-lysine N-methyltransferase 2D-like isoform X2 n=1 Tax=Megalobrama amblycephala TaxID=75352 RepID=UPI002013E03A|nr:histone-lysine N-methyltransferase 2D-like isoform X2 [Megalobrama amblycephala]
MAHMMGERGGQAVRSADSFDGWLCPPLPGQVPVEPKETLRGLTAQGAMEASPVSESSTEKPTERRKRKQIRSFLNRPWKAVEDLEPESDPEPQSPAPDLEPESDPEPPSPAPDLEPEPDPEPPSPAPDHSGVKPTNEKPTERRKRKRIRSFLNRPWKAMKSPFRCCCPCSDVDVVEPFVPPPDLEPESDPEPPSPAPDLEPESDPEPPSPAPDHSGVKPINEKPTERRKRKRIRSFLNRLWKAMKSPFRCCCPCSDVDVVEPFVPPPDLEPEPDPEPQSPAPDLEPEPDPEPQSPAPDLEPESDPEPDPEPQSPAPDLEPESDPEPPSPAPDHSGVKPINEKPTERRKRKRIRSFLNRPWKAMKSPFRCCCPCSDVDVVEPFVPPPDLEPESDPEPPSPAPDLEPESDPEPPSPAPDHSGVKPINEKPTERRKRKRIRSFLNRLWKAMKSPFRCCCPCSDVDVVEPFVPPPDLEPEPDPEPQSPAPDLEPEPDPEPQSPAPDLEPESDPEPDPEPQSPAPDLEPESDPEPPSPAPDHSGVKPINESFESLYNVGAMLGSGGFGRVYEGTRKFDGKKVAIKQMLKIDNDRYLHIPGHPKPLVTEVALLLMMRREPICPYVIHLYEWFEHPQTFTLVMEYPEPCESLHDFIARNPRLCEPAAQLIVLQAMMALLHCLERGVFHHDIHAENFLWNKDTFRLKLIDFGCGQLFSSDGYESKIYIGAPLYCPPEVLTEPRFHAVPTNVWALGVLLYKMVNGCLPFRSRREITQAKITFHNSTLSEECADLISQCLARDPTKRPTLEQMFQHEWITSDLDWGSSGDSVCL